MDRHKAFDPRSSRRFMHPARLAALVLGTAALSATVIAAHSAYVAYGLVHAAPRHLVSKEAEARARADFPGLERVTLKTTDGLKLRGWFAPGPRRAAVVFVHGGEGNRLQLMPEARLLSRHGYGVLLYDSRACGESDGELVTWGDRERFDLRSAIDFLSARPDVDPARIGVIGFSIGASTVVIEVAADPRARAVVLFATWSSLEDEMKRNRGRYGFLSWQPMSFVMRHYGLDVDAVRPVDLIARIHPRPLLMIAGERDEDTPVAVMQQVFRAAEPPKELWVEPGVGHGGYWEGAPAEYESRVTAFFDATLGAP